MYRRYDTAITSTRIEYLLAAQCSGGSRSSCLSICCACCLFVDLALSPWHIIVYCYHPFFVGMISIIRNIQVGPAGLKARLMPSTLCLLYHNRRILKPLSCKTIYGIIATFQAPSHAIGVGQCHTPPRLPCAHPFLLFNGVLATAVGYSINSRSLKFEAGLPPRSLATRCVFSPSVFATIRAHSAPPASIPRYDAICYSTRVRVSYIAPSPLRTAHTLPPIVGTNHSASKRKDRWISYLYPNGP